MDRRRFLNLSAAGATAALLQQHPTVSLAKDRPNVLFIPVDDLNDWIGCMGGHPQGKTPNIDKLALRGTIFHKAYCSAPLCNPSRASLLSGLRPTTTGVYGNQQPLRLAAPDVVTLPQWFRQNGYNVQGGGKVFHGGHPDPDSWDFYFNKGGWPRPEIRPANGILNAGGFDWSPIDAEDSDLKDGRVADWTIEELDKSREKPFFHACGMFRPHLPWYVPQKYFDMHPLDEIVLPVINNNDLDDVPPIGHQMAIDGIEFPAAEGGDHAAVLRTNQWKNGVQGYLASASYADAQIGRVLDALDTGPYKDNTIIVLWGDHGWHLGEKLHWRKHALWEEATRNPLIIVAPGVTTPGSKCFRTVSLLDLYPTLLELCGLPANPTNEGVSLVPLLKNPELAWDRPAVTTYKYMNHAVRSERWRYIRYADGTEELYDHYADDLEWHNLAGDQQYAAVKKELARWLPKSNAPDAPEKE